MSLVPAKMGEVGGGGSTKILHESLCITVHIVYMLLAISCDTEIYDLCLCGTNIVRGGGGVKCTTSHAAIKEVAILAFRWRDGIRHAQFGQTTRMNKVATCLKKTVLPVVFVCSCFVSFK